ncbi:MAG: divergent PAP2 family protein [Candidatus Aenigmarchaeota archaeon]|nr:divergent PAP2 family protein [Candidatus Aenigmarchaeota archaeon]MCK5321751.1 divergent PAP2 family protein [Candidatus Aenigmarchaeota archaeon]
MTLGSDLIILITNPIIISVVLAFLTSMFLKFLASDEQTFKSFLLSHGGMPSTHSSSVCALVVAIYFTEGITTLLIFSLIFAITTVNDAINSRYEIGVHAKILNKIMKNPKYQLLERVGHKPIEAFIGILVGISVATIVHFVPIAIILIRSILNQI